MKPTFRLPIIVMGSGPAALLTVASLLQLEAPIVWVGGSSLRLHTPLGSVEAIAELSAFYQVLSSYLPTEDFAPIEESKPALLEFRNQALRPVSWAQTADPAVRQSIQRELLGATQSQWVSEPRVRFLYPVTELLERLSAAVHIRLAESSSPHRKITEVPPQGFQREMSRGAGVVGLILGSGEIIASGHIIYADSFRSLVQLEGLPRVLPMSVRRAPMSALQAVFQFAAPIGKDLRQSFYLVLDKPNDQRSAAQEHNHLWGNFSADGHRSYWFLPLDSAYSENHGEIAKRFRKLRKGALRILSHTFPNEDLTIVGEHLTYEEEAFLTGGRAFDAPLNLDQLPGITFLTDGYGLGATICQLARINLKPNNPPFLPPSYAEQIERSGGSWGSPGNI